jgi:hypothetical protein
MGSRFVSGASCSDLRIAVVPGLVGALAAYEVLADLRSAKAAVDLFADDAGGARKLVSNGKNKSNIHAQIAGYLGRSADLTQLLNDFVTKFGGNH